MGFYTTALSSIASEAKEEVYQTRRWKIYPPSKNRVWDFSSCSRVCTQRSAAQVLELHRENRPTPTIIVSGVRYYGYRYLHPELGRWISRDPIGERGGINLYTFVRNDPVAMFDPFGLDAKKECKAECDLGDAGSCEFKGFWYSPISPEGRRLIRDARDLAGQKDPDLPPSCPADIIKKFVSFPITALEGAAQGGGVLIDGFEDWARNNWPWSMYIKYSARHCETPCKCECGKGEWGKKEDRYFYCGEQFYRDGFTIIHKRTCFNKWKSMCGGEFTFGGIYRYDPE